MQSTAAAIIKDEQNIKQLGSNFSIPVTEWRQPEQNKTQCDARGNVFTLFPKAT